MKKADLVDVVAQQKNLPRQQVEITVDALIEAVAEGLAKGERSANPPRARAVTRRLVRRSRSKLAAYRPSRPARSFETR